MWEKERDIAHGYSIADDSIALKNGLALLTERQRLAIAYRYFYGYSDSEIAHMFAISRQAVNKLHRRAIAVLKQYYTESK